MLSPQHSPTKTLYNAASKKTASAEGEASAATSGAIDGHIVVPGNNPNAPRYLASPGDEFDSVVNISTGSGLGTGVVLEGGRYVLTAAHVVEGALANNTSVNFDLLDGRQSVGVDHIHIHPDWVFGSPSSYPLDEMPGYDIALIELATQAPTEGHAIYRGSDEVGQDFILSGYGLEGTGGGGANPYDPNVGDIKRWGMNTYDALDTEMPFNFVNAAADSLLFYDFDDGSYANDTLGNWLSNPDRGLGIWEVMAAPGDSGGPAFLEQSDGSLNISGLVQGGGGNSTFGSIGAITRISHYSDWIDSVTETAAPLPDEEPTPPPEDTGLTPAALIDTLTADLGVALSTAQRSSLEAIFAAAIGRGDDVALSMLGGVSIRSALEAEYGTLSGASLGQAIGRLNDIVDQAMSQPSPEPEPENDHGNTIDTATVWNNGTGDASITGRIDPLGDRDFFEVFLDADYEYTFDLVRSDDSRLDTFIRLFDASGSMVDSDDDSGTNLNAQLSYSPEQSNRYYLEASAWFDNSTGEYTLAQSTSALAPPAPTPPPTHEGFDYTLNYVNGSAMGSAFSNVDEGIKAALDYWGQFIDSHSAANINIDITYDPISSNALASAGFTYSVPTGKFVNGKQIFNSGVQHELTTGLNNNGGNADAVINIHSTDLTTNNWWYDPTPMDRTDNAPGAHQLDFVGVMLHEFGHALGFISSYQYTNAQGFVQPNDYVFAMDEFINWNASQTEFYYTGANSQSAYAAIGGTGPVPLYVAPDEPGSSFAHYGGNGSQAGLLEGYLMNPSVTRGQLLDVSELDLAFLDDMGYNTINHNLAATGHDISAHIDALAGIQQDETHWLI